MPRCGCGCGRAITARLAASPPALAAYAACTSFCVYFCMYAFRRPWQAHTYDGEGGFFGSAWDLKTALLVAQSIGYATAKACGARLIPQVRRGQRAACLVGLVVAAEAALLGFAVAPTPSWRAPFLLLNGVTLGGIWGLVVWYLEGRSTAELLLCSVSFSYIVAGGAVRDFGLAVLDGGAADAWGHVCEPVAAGIRRGGERWMPFITGLHFLPPYLLSVWLLNLLPEPSAADEDARTRRATMPPEAQYAFARHFRWPLGLLCANVFSLTAYREYRDAFQVELLDELGSPAAGGDITLGETVVGVLSVLTMGALYWVPGHRRALAGCFVVMLAGAVCLLACAALLTGLPRVSGLWWLVAVGLGVNLVFVPPGAVLFERTIAAAGARATANFPIYVVDACGVVGSVVVLSAQGAVGGGRLPFFRAWSYWQGAGGLGLIAAAAVLHLRAVDGGRRSPAPDPDLPAAAGAAALELPLPGAVEGDPILPRAAAGPRGPGPAPAAGTDACAEI